MPQGRAVQVDPGFFAVDPTLAFRDFQRLKLTYDELLSNFAFNVNPRHYSTERPECGTSIGSCCPPEPWWGGAG